jgi:hypothetical protein
MPQAAAAAAGKHFMLAAAAGSKSKGVHASLLQLIQAVVCWSVQCSCCQLEGVSLNKTSGVRIVCVRGAVLLLTRGAWVCLSEWQD